MIPPPAITAEAPVHRPGRETGWPADLPSVGSYVECRMCGFEPAEQLLLPRRRCPKCFSETWRRSVRPGTLLAEASEGRSPKGAKLTEVADDDDDDVVDLAHRHGPARL